MPIPAGKFCERSIGEQINRTFKQVYFLTFAVCQPKRIMLVAAGAVAQNAAAVGRTESGVFRFLLLVKANENNVVIGQAFKDNAFFDTFIGDCSVNSSAKKILPDPIGRFAFFGQEQDFRLFFLLWSNSQHRHNRRLSHQGFHRLHKRNAPDLYKIVKSVISADSLRPPHPFTV